MKVESDHGTVLPAGSYALVWTADSGWELYIPDKIKGDDLIPEEVLALTGMLIKLGEGADFMHEMADYFKKLERE